MIIHKERKKQDLTLEPKIHNFYVGGEKWNFSDKIYMTLTKKRIRSNYNPKIFTTLQKIPNLIPNKEVFGLFWSKPTFKDVDCNYLLHLSDKDNIDYIISTSSGNTVESMARTIKKYNSEKHKNVKAILLVPELSSYKVSKSAIIDNPYVKFIVLKNSTLDSTRRFARELIDNLNANYKVVCADANKKTAAYAQIGFALKEEKLLNDNVCYVQTVSGGVGATGFIESALQLKENPEILVIQPSSEKSSPIVDALFQHSNGKDPLSVFKNGKYTTSRIEPTLGSGHPLYAIDKFVQWRENGGRIIPGRITKEDLVMHKEKILDALVNAGVYPDKDIGSKMYDLEKSGFIAFVGAIIFANKIESSNIVINFTGRYPDPDTLIPKPATPHLIFNPSKGVQELIKNLNL